MISPELFRKLRRIRLRTAHVADELLAGQYRSAFRGRGMEFEEVRPYQVGDDVRAIDWKVTARLGAPHVKLFREERELTTFLLVDASGSTSVGTHGQLKRELIAEVASLLAFAACRNNDKVGLMLFTDRVEKCVPAGKGLRHAMRIVRDLLHAQPRSPRTSLRIALEQFQSIVKRRSVVFLFSDFRDTGYEEALRIARRKHDLVAVSVADQRELQLPRAGLVRIVDPESGRLTLLDTSSFHQRRAYQHKAQQQVEHRRRLMRQLDVDWIELFTGEDPVEPLRRFLLQRGKRR